MKIKNKTNLSIFTELEKINPNLKLFILEDGSNLDIIFNDMFSERTLLNANKDNNNYATLINVLFAKKWDSAYSLFDNANLVMSSLGIDDTREKIITEIINDNQSDINSISAFNVEDFSNNDKDIKDYKREREFKESEINNNKDINNFAVSWEYLQKNYIQDIIFHDVINTISLKIYESEEK